MRRAPPIFALLLLSTCPLSAEPFVPGLKIREAARAFEAAAASGARTAIGEPECSPGMPGFFCSYAAGPGLRLITGAPTLESDIDSLEVESTGHTVSEPLRRLLGLTITVLEPRSSSQERADLLKRLIAAAQVGKEATLRSERVEFTFDSFGYGLVFGARLVAG